jgi:small subunit ribosomal protein S14
MRLKLDIPRRINCHDTEIRNKVLKTMVSKSELALSTRWSISKRFAESLNYQSRLNNRCNVNGKSRTVSRCLRLNRLTIASFQARGFIKGAYKASW